MISNIWSRDSNVSCISARNYECPQLKTDGQQRIVRSICTDSLPARARVQLSRQTEDDCTDQNPISALRGEVCHVGDHQHSDLNVSLTITPTFHYSALTSDQVRVKNALILFSVKDKDYFGMANQYIAEALLSFEEILNGSASEQLHLTLTRPNNLGKGTRSSTTDPFVLCMIYVPFSDSEALRALELRQFDKQAKEFLKKLKQKVNNQA